MLDILLTPDGDLYINDSGDIVLTDNMPDRKPGIRQAIRIRLQWFFGEWKFAPPYGVPYFEDVLVKNPNLERIKGIIREEVLSIKEVRDVKNLVITVDKKTRSAKASMDVVLDNDMFREEVVIVV